MTELRLTPNKITLGNYLQDECGCIWHARIKQERFDEPGVVRYALWEVLSPDSERPPRVASVRESGDEFMCPVSPARKVVSVLQLTKDGLPINSIDVPVVNVKAGELERISTSTDFDDEEDELKGIRMTSRNL